MKQPQLKLLLRLLEESYNKKSWHGTNLRGSIRGLTATQAAWRPARNRHNIWEIVVHCAYWKYTVRRRLLGEQRGSFALKGSNWFKCPDERSDHAWKQDVQLLEREHQAMIDTIANFTDRRLDHMAPGSTHRNRFVISGIAAHDLYHAGQIQLLKCLQQS